MFGLLLVIACHNNTHDWPQPHVPHAPWSHVIITLTRQLLTVKIIIPEITQTQVQLTFIQLRPDDVDIKQ